MNSFPPSDLRATHAPPAHSPLAVALAGMAALGAAMGIGRFAFTPLLPMMLQDGALTLAGGSWLATANYLGYLLGALLCMALPWWARRAGRAWPAARMARAGLAAAGVLTLAMALPVPGAWPTLRFLAGVTSAFVFLNISAWCMARLVALGRPALGGLIFCGPGLGILLTGLSASAMVAGGWPAAAGWAAFGVLAVVLCAAAWPVVHGAPEAPGPAAVRQGAQPTAAAAAAASPMAGGGQGEVLARVLLTVAYGLAGLGYIVTATFLPVIARSALPAGSVWVDLFWPIFGAGVALGAWLSTRTPARWDRRHLLLAAYLVQAGAIGLGLAWPGAAGFALGSLVLGLPFTAITFYALQEARRLWPQASDSFPGLLTAAYGVGQIAGPPMVAWMLHHTASEATGFTLGLGAAASALVLGAALFAFMAWRWPLGAPVRP
ncbi:YbfB/YjiJ family MFS transporter [Acidovorax sp. NCPPB 4044]|uniref:YbfB/YjiJ family MFS transporter n=1 Tax=Acidovorax sp. NCPPB 4044 TaxID=2940490 RepID=UPI00230324A0|nr:YbfB/YjiJ family MFS transporter [Acidovorax sp. NCPPB 4044]MDA8523048.1 YbfB/YjiJ family MFS transporter [Acidovorax sp. NCPPB 4044]